MLLKKSLRKFVSLKKHKKDSKPTNALPLGRKGRYGFSVYMAAVLCACCFSTTAFAASDPLGVVNNLSTFIFSLILSLIHIYHHPRNLWESSPMGSGGFFCFHGKEGYF